MMTLTWKSYGAVDGNPNNPENWSPEGVPTAHTNVVFSWGEVKLDPNTPWTAHSVTLAGGSTVTFSTTPHVINTVDIEGGGRLYLTAPTGDLRTHTINIANGGSITSAVPVDTHALYINGGGRFEAQNGFTAHFVNVDGGSSGWVYGEIYITCPPEVAPGSTWNEHHGCNCYARGTMVLMHDNTEKAIELIRAGDVIHGGHVVNWLGMSNRKAKFVKISKGTLGATRDLVVTEDHLILIVDVLYPARMLTYMLGIDYCDYDSEYYHLQTARHNMLIANGVKSETYFDVDGNNDLSTVSGERLNKRFDRSEAFGTIIAPMNHALAA